LVVAGAGIYLLSTSTVGAVWVLGGAALMVAVVLFTQGIYLLVMSKRDRR
jgi:hypothetical protein